MSAKIRLNQLQCDEFRFDLVAENRAVLGVSDCFAAKSDALDAIDSLKRHMFSCRYLIGLDDKHYFELCSKSGMRLLRSQSYSSKSAAVDGMLFAKQTATAAKVIERDT